MECIPCNAECCKEKSYIIIITPEEVEDILSKVGGSFEDYFEYYKGRKHLPIIKVSTDKRCVFLNEDNACKVQSYKPDICKRYNYPKCKGMLERE